jgi:hypothetical protein
MDWQSMLKYGKAPIIRGMAWGIAFILGYFGYKNVQAADFLNGIWEPTVAIVVAGTAFYHSIRSDRNLHESSPPAESEKK